MVQASVGFQCPECANQRTQRVVTSRQMWSTGTSNLIATKVIIGLNVAAYFLMVSVGGSASASGSVYEEGALYGPFVANGEWWRLITGGFLHANLMHLGLNMFLLWLLSKELEPTLGTVRYVTLYLVSLLGSSLAVMMFAFESPTLGASGAVYGLMGALVALQLRAKQNPWNTGLGGLIVLNLAVSFVVPGISWQGHIGGLLAGAAAGAILQPLRWPQDQALVRTSAVWAIGGLIAIAAIIAANAGMPQYY